MGYIILISRFGKGGESVAKFIKNQAHYELMLAIAAVVFSTAAILIFRAYRSGGYINQQVLGAWVAR